MPVVKLQSFHIRNYRSVNDSGRIEIADCTALVGRNESGKTNLLLALESLNPADQKLEALTFVKDFPRDRHKSAFSEDTTVVESWWTLSPDEQQQLAEILPRAKGVSEVLIGRGYKAARWVDFGPLPELTVDAEAVAQDFTKIRQSVSGGFAKVPDVAKNAITESLDALCESPPKEADSLAQWALSTAERITTLNRTSSRNNIEVPPLAKEHLYHLAAIVGVIAKDKEKIAEALKWIVEQMPVFIYLSDYPELHGHEDIPDFLRAKRGERRMEEPDRNFQRLCKVAGLDPEELQQLLSHGHEERQQLTNRAGAVVTRKIRDLWKDRQLSVRFSLDANHFDTLISDQSAGYPVEINFDDRSRGFKWFFSFYIAFAADTSGGPAENAVLLLDEPGLYLHAVAQRDLLEHFDRDFKNQIVFTTHSPFMIPVHDLSRIRTVQISQERGTEVTNDIQGDSKTLYPLQTALGYDLTQTLFVGDKNIVVEGVTDYWYLISASDYLLERGKAGLPKGLVMTPAGGAQKIPYMVAFLAAQNLKVLVLLDQEPGAQQSKEDLIKAKLIRSDNVISIGDGFEKPSGSATDIEDLLDPVVFDQLVRESYADELKKKTLNLNANIPRIVKRYEEAFRNIGLEFHKTRPARLFLRKIASKPETVFTDVACRQFSRLFGVIADRLMKRSERAARPFI